MTGHESNKVCVRGKDKKSFPAIECFTEVNQKNEAAEVSTFRCSTIPCFIIPIFIISKASTSVSAEIEIVEPIEDFVRTEIVE